MKTPKKQKRPGAPLRNSTAVPHPERKCKYRYYHKHIPAYHLRASSHFHLQGDFFSQIFMLAGAQWKEDFLQGCVQRIGPCFLQSWTRSAKVGGCRCGSHSQFRAKMSHSWKE